VVVPRGGRAEFALRLPAQGAAGSHAEVAPAADDGERERLRPESVTVEAWVKLAVPTVPGVQGVAGNAYSYSLQAGTSLGAGHFGYGLFCTADAGGAGAMFSCGMHVGTRTDPSGARSLVDLCPQLGFESGVYCGGQPGYTTSHRVESPVNIAPNTWVHVGGSYDAGTGILLLVVNGALADESLVTYIDPATNETLPKPIAYSGLGAAYPMSTVYPWHRTDWTIGSMLIGIAAPTVEKAPRAYLTADVDEVRVWSSGRTLEDIRDHGYFDTVAPGTAHLLGYWPFDDPAFFHSCADDTRVGRDASVIELAGGAGLGRIPAILSGSAILVLSSAPLDRPAAFSADTPADGTQMIVHLGDSVHITAAAIDPNPSDRALLRLELPGEVHSHPTGATYSDIVAQGAFFSWSPLARDAGKAVSLCFSLTNLVDNPLRSDFVLAPLALRTCVTLHVPLCKYRTVQGDTFRTIAARFRTTWRALFLVNPEVTHPDDLSAGMVIRIGSLFALDRNSSVQTLVDTVRASWSAVANNNNALLYRLWTDQYLLRAPGSAAAEHPLTSLDAGQGVYDISFSTLDQLHNYSGAEVCLVAQLNSNCI